MTAHVQRRNHRELDWSWVTRSLRWSFARPYEPPTEPLAHDRVGPVLADTGDVAQNAKGMGEKAVEVAVQVIKDKNAAATIPKVIDSGLTLVHPWNVDAYSKENFGK